MSHLMHLKGQSSCVGDKCNHMFSLKPLKTGLYHRDELQITFCPQFCTKTQTHSNTWPQAFVDDKVHFPLFMLEVDRQATTKREKEYVEAHKNRIRILETINQQILVPHPGKLKNTCFVCKSQYTDYKRHIQTKVHKKKLNSSKMQSSISELVQLVSNCEQKRQHQNPKFYNSSLIRLSSLKTDTSYSNICSRTYKKQLKQIKLKQKMFQIEDICFIQVEDKQKCAQIQLQGLVRKGQDIKTTTVDMISMHQFRISDYLI